MSPSSHMHMLRATLIIPVPSKTFLSFILSRGWPFICTSPSTINLFHYVILDPPITGIPNCHKAVWLLLSLWETLLRPLLHLGFWATLKLYPQQIYLLAHQLLGLTSISGNWLVIPLGRCKCFSESLVFLEEELSTLFPTIGWDCFELLFVF